MKRMVIVASAFCLLLSLGGSAWGGGVAAGQEAASLDPPTALKLVIVQNAFQLSWKPSPQDPGKVTGYEIFRSTNLASGPFVKVSQVGKGVFQYTDKKAAAENIYYYKVRAVAGSAASPFSNTVTGER
jgi:hypothetical protein